MNIFDQNLNINGLNITDIDNHYPLFTVYNIDSGWWLVFCIVFPIAV